MKQATSNRPTAASLAAMFSAETIEHFETLDNAKAALNKGPLIILADLRRDFGDDNMALLPVPGTDKDSGHEVYDIVEGMIQNAKGDMVKSKVVFTNELFGLSALGLAIKTAKERLEHAAQGRTKEAGEYAGLDRIARKAEMSRLTQKETTGRNNIRKAIQIHQQIEAITLNLPALAVELMQDSDGDWSASPKPIMVGEQKKLGKSDVVSIGTFLSWNPELAAENATGADKQFEELLKTAGRESDKNKVTQPPVKTFVGFHLATSATAHFMLDVKEKGTKGRAEMARELNADGSDELLYSMFVINRKFDAYLSMPGIEARMMAIVEASEKQRKAA